MMAAAARTPPLPCGANGCRLSALKAVKASTMNNPSTASLMTTMMLLRVAVSLTPRTSRQVMASTMTTAGRLMPPSGSEVVNFSGSATPKVVPSGPAAVRSVGSGTNRPDSSADTTRLTCEGT